ncbi:MAG: topoisomerase DNA-binding C4 zinc finger domain-containing protein [Bacilli bacterium]|nr:topoisomerase DNA-binding C4 zinc finger domain-containing protein [Bacilli bacterium]
MKNFIGTYIVNNPIFWIVLIGSFLGFIIYKEFTRSSNYLRNRSGLKTLPKEHYYVLNDIVVRSARKSYKIDTIIISTYGIFIIKYINRMGKIYGDEREEDWIELRDKKKTYFENPARENRACVRILSEILGLDTNYFVSVICFPSEAVLSLDIKDKVTSVELLDDTIRTYRKEVIKYGLTEIRNKVKKNNVSKKDISDEEIPIPSKSKNTCPKCGGELVVRKGKYGDFLGCRNYPKCKYTKEI